MSKETRESIEIILVGLIVLIGLLKLAQTVDNAGYGTKVCTTKYKDNTYSIRLEDNGMYIWVRKEYYGFEIKEFLTTTYDCETTEDIIAELKKRVDTKERKLNKYRCN